METCKSLGLVSVNDLLKWYNNLDVSPLLRACLKQKEFYYKFDLDTYKDGFSLPGLSKNILFQFAQKGFQEYLKSCPDVETSKFSYPKNIYKKITSYIEQDIKASRSLDNYIREDEIMELFKNKNLSVIIVGVWASFTAGL